MAEQDPAAGGAPVLTDHEIAERIRDGVLSSPQRIGKCWLFDLRITGTGAAYRPSYDEFAVRDPATWLTDEMVERCNGLTVTFVHPNRDALDTQEYRERAIGSVVLPYKTATELRGIAKVFDDDAAMLMQGTFRSTSPGVLARPDAQPIELPDGTRVLDEGTPLIFDHLAICQNGVWDKGRAPDGVRLDSALVTARPMGWHRHDDAAFNESDHPRDSDGKFTDGRSDEMSRHDAGDAPGNGKEPYGKASEADYADPGYQPDKEKRYPLKKDGEWDAERIRAAWDYIHHKKDGDKYTPEQRKEIEGRIVRAWKAGIDKDGPPEADNRKDSTMADKSEAEDRRDAGDDLEKVTKERDDLKRRLDALEKKMRADESEKERAENTREEDEERHDETDEEKRALKAANEARERERKDETEKTADARDEAAGKKEGREDRRSDARPGDDRGRADDRGAPDCPVEPDAPAMTAKPVHDAARVRELEQQVRTLRDQMAGLHYQPSIEDRNRIAELHHRADSLYQMLGDQAPRPLPGEGPAPYARRLASGLRKFTKSFKSYAIKDSLDEQAFGLVEAEIYREAEHTARNPVEPPPGGLREVRTMENGKQVSRFYGDARATWAPFMPPTITRMTFNHDRVRQAQQRI